MKFEKQAKRSNFEDKQRIGFREEFQDNVYLPIETVWAKVFDYYYRGYDGSNMYSKITLTMADENKKKIFAASEMIKAILKQDQSRLHARHRKDDRKYLVVSFLIYCETYYRSSQKMKTSDDHQGIGD